MRDDNLITYKEEKRILEYLRKNSPSTKNIRIYQNLYININVGMDTIWFLWWDANNWIPRRKYLKKQIKKLSS
jgi:hypothetical protein